MWIELEMAQKRRYREYDYNCLSQNPSKRPRNEPYLFERDYMSLPQNDHVYHYRYPCRYDLRPQEHRRPPVQLYSTAISFQRRNAHSYSLNDQRCSNSSTASSRKRKVDEWRKESQRNRKRPHEDQSRAGPVSLLIYSNFSISI